MRKIVFYIRVQVCLQGLVIFHFPLVETFPIPTSSCRYTLSALLLLQSLGVQGCDASYVLRVRNIPSDISPIIKVAHHPLHIVCCRYNAHRWARNEPTWTRFDNVPPLFCEGDALVVLVSESHGRLLLMLQTWFWFHTRWLRALDCWACSTEEKRKAVRFTCAFYRILP